MVPSYHPDPSTRGVASASGVLGASVLLCSESAVPVSYVPFFPFPAFYLFALPVGVSVHVAWALGGLAMPCQEVLLAMWVLMCCVRLTAGFYSRWCCSLPPPCHSSSMCLAHQAQVSASHTAFLVFITASSSRLLFVVSQRPIISSPAVLVDSLFLVWVVIISSRRLGLRFPSGRPST